MATESCCSKPHGENAQKIESLALLRKQSAIPLPEAEMLVCAAENPPKLLERGERLLVSEYVDFIARFSPAEKPPHAELLGQGE